MLKKFFALLLVLAVAVSVMSMATFAEETPDLPVIFIKDGGTGDGSSPDKALGYGAITESSKLYKNAPLWRAWDTLLKAGGGTIVVCGEVSLNKADGMPGRAAPGDLMYNANYGYGGLYEQYKDVHITYTSVWGGVDYRETAGAKLQFDDNQMSLTFPSPTTLENITIAAGATSDRANYLCGNFYELKLGNGTNFVANATGKYPVIVGGQRNYNGITNIAGDTNIVVDIGEGNTVGDIYGLQALNAKDQTGNCYITVKSGTVGSIVGDGQHAGTKGWTGSINIAIEGGVIKGAVTVCNNGYAAAATDKVATLKISGGDFTNCAGINAVSKDGLNAPNEFSIDCSAAPKAVYDVVVTKTSLNVIAPAEPEPTEPPVTTVTASKTVADLIKEHGWTSSTTKQQFMLDDAVTVKINGGSNTGKAYEGDHIRVYATDTPAGTITISVPEGCELVSVKISAKTDGTYAYLCVDGTSTDICNKTTEVSGNSVVLNSVKNGSNGKQVRVTAFEVVYTTSGSVPEHQHNAEKVESDANGHWTICTCGDESTKSAVEAHTLTNHICSVCGYVATPTTVADIIACAYALPNGGKIPGTIELTGTIKSIDEAWSTQYKNITLTMVVEGFEDYPIVCFRMKSTDAADASTVVVGNIITVSGTLMKYTDGTVEFSPCELKALTTEPEATEPEATEPEATEPEATEPEATEPEATEPEATEPEATEPGTAPEYTKQDSLTAGTAYKFGMLQGNVGKVFYLKGGMNGYYMDTTEDINEAIDVFVEETEGGYYFYTMVDGAKTYINMVVSGTHVNGAYEAAASTVYTFKNGTLVAIVNDAEYWSGTRNDKTYTTMGPCAVSYEGFYGEFYAAASAPIDPAPETGDSVSVVIAMMAVSALALAVVGLKKKEF